MIKNKHFKNLIIKSLFPVTISFALLINPIATLYSFADSYSDAMEYNKTLPISTNEIDNWPAGPVVSAYSAILIDADTGVVLYEKNSHEKMYPASTTKLLTCLLAMEDKKSNLNDMVKFSYDAVMSIPRDGSNMGMDAGESMTLEECLYGILVVSANEVANAVAEYVSGDIDSFVKLMNLRAKELGCTDSHFNNPHGYSDPDHYTSAHDLAKIGKVFFDNELLSKISRTPNYHWYATDTQPDEFVLGSTNYFMKGIKECEGIVGSKTGFTDESRQCLITCAERNGMKLICVVMSEETPYQYDDTLTLFNYGFSNFEKLKVSDYETKYTVDNDTFFHSKLDVFGDSSEIFTLDTDSIIIIPKTLNFSDLSSSIKYNNNDKSKVATITYTYNNAYLGESFILFNSDDEEFVFDETYEDDEIIEEEEPTFIYVNQIIYGLISIAIIFIIITGITKLLSNYHIETRHRTYSRNSRRKRSSGPNYKIDKKRIKSSRNNKLKF